MGQLVKVGTVDEFREGRGRAVDVGGVRVAVFRTRSGFVAFTDACPHMGASLADGRLDGGHVECAWHAWRYDVRTGKNDRKEWACVTVYPARVEGNDVLLECPDPPAPPEEPPEEDDWAAGDPARFFRKRTDGQDDPSGTQR